MTCRECDRPASWADGGRGGLCSLHYKRVQVGMTDARKYRTRVGKRTPEEILTRDLAGRKYCTGCDRWLHEDKFRRDRRAVDNLACQCGSCHVARSHGMHSSLEYESLLELQDGCCAICGEPPRNGARLVIDHDRSHCPGARSCGECVRGLLHVECNAGLGLLGDNPEGLQRALLYLMGAHYSDPSEIGILGQLQLRPV